MSKLNIIVAGGTGYIGSHTVLELLQNQNYSVSVIDNLSKGHRNAIPQNVKLYQGDIRDASFLDQVFDQVKPDVVMHFCASISVGESVQDPLAYYENNVSGTITLLQSMIKHNCLKFVFSSTAAVFGEPTQSPIPVDERTLPINPYGETKLIVEKLLKSCDEAYGLKSVCLRYFNACGAAKDGHIGEDHEPETHLIPLILQVPMGKRDKIIIFGDDYPTPDGTCIRDYIHVTDLATAHIAAIEWIVKEGKSGKFNLGSGKGYSVKEIVDAARRVTGHAIPAEIKQRRPGDPPSLVASSKEAEEVLGWKRRFVNIDDIVATAWQWHQSHPKGYNH